MNDFVTLALPPVKWNNRYTRLLTLLLLVCGEYVPGSFCFAEALGKTNAVSDITHALIVTSNPSGAEIYINDKNTGFTTPSRVEIPSGKFKISFHKDGYSDTVMSDVTSETLGPRLVAKLVKVKIPAPPVTPRKDGK